MEEGAAKAKLRVKKAAQREEKTSRDEQKESKATKRQGDKEPQNSVPAKRACIEMHTHIWDGLGGVCMWALLHEDCVNDCVIDEGGNQQLCFVCLNGICN